jgi:hypothetical protein
VIFCTDEPRYVAGFSNMDPHGAEDPVPYLDRTCSVANGMLNGRERLMPGDRLVWLPEPDSSASLASVVFEAVDHCQVASRTWSPCLNSLGYPLTLNDFTHDEMSPEAASAVRQALKLPMPRTWAPRDNRGDSWIPLGTITAQAEHWLPQLAPRRMRRSGA